MDDWAAWRTTSIRQRRFGDLFEKSLFTHDPRFDFLMINDRHFSLPGEQLDHRSTRDAAPFQIVRRTMADDFHALGGARHVRGEDRNAGSIRVRDRCADALRVCTASARVTRSPCAPGSL